MKLTSKKYSQMIGEHLHIFGFMTEQEIRCSLRVTRVDVENAVRDGEIQYVQNGYIATESWTAALQVARECGAEAARQSPRPTPEWTGEPILQGDWDAIIDVLGYDPGYGDSAANQELIDAWLAGYEAIRHNTNPYEIDARNNTATSQRRLLADGEGGYQGYKNYETCAVTMWIDNDRNDYQYWNDAADEIKRQITKGGPYSKYQSDEDSIKFTLADMMKDYFEEGNPITENSVYNDLLNTALAEVDWNEVAQTFLEE